MPESSEQGLVERLLADAKPEPKIDTTLFVSQERQADLVFGATLSFSDKDDIADAIGTAIEETVRTIQRHTRDRAEAQSAQIAELQADVERLRGELVTEAGISRHMSEQLLITTCQIADLKRALDTARNDALGEAKRLADRYAIEPDPDEEDPYDDYGMGCRSTARCISRDIAALGSASPLSQGGQK